MAKDDLFHSLSPLYWFLRVIGATPFHHGNSLGGILNFSWCHKQTLWFTFVTLVHLAFISAQVFQGIFGLTPKVDQDVSGTQLIINPMSRYTNSISQARFLVDTFLIPKLVSFNLSSLQILLDRLDGVDYWVSSSSSVVRRARQFIILSICLAVFWHSLIWVFAIRSIICEWRQDSILMIITRILDSLIHTVGQLHSNTLVIHFASVCYMIGLRYAALVDLLFKTVRTEHSLYRLLGGWMDPLDLDESKCSAKHSMRNRVLPSDGTLTQDIDPPVTILDRLQRRSLTLRLVFLKTLYLTLSDTVSIQFNRVFGFTLLCFLISKLISNSIGCYDFINQLLEKGFVDFYWFLSNLPDIVSVYVTFQAADFVTGKAKKVLSSANKISTQNLTNTEQNELQTFLLQVRGAPIELSVCGLFKLGKQLLPAVAGTIATYILVLLQFDA